LKITFISEILDYTSTENNIEVIKKTRKNLTRNKAFSNKSSMKRLSHYVTLESNPYCTAQYTTIAVQNYFSRE
jgi:hypothetical protein